MTTPEQCRRWREAKAAREGRVLLTHSEVIARAHAAAHAKLRQGMCVCGTCRRCKRRAWMRAARRRSQEPGARSQNAEIEFPIFAEELASVMRFPMRRSGARAAA